MLHSARNDRTGTSQKLQTCQNRLWTATLLEDELACMAKWQFSRSINDSTVSKYGRPRRRKATYLLPSLGKLGLYSGVIAPAATILVTRFRDHKIWCAHRPTSDQNLPLLFWRSVQQLSEGRLICWKQQLNLHMVQPRTTSPRGTLMPSNYNFYTIQGPFCGVLLPFNLNMMSRFSN